MRTSASGLSNKMEGQEERITELKDRKTEISQQTEQRD